MMSLAAALLCGFLFAVGLAIAGMTQPHKVIGFLNVLDWDPTLAFVMVGAIGVHFFALKFIRRRTKPILDTKFHYPEKRGITKTLVLGSSIFGVGWGLAGYCPGPAISSLATGRLSVVVFIGMMAVGMKLGAVLSKN